MLLKIIKNIKEKFKDKNNLFSMDTNLRDEYYKEIEVFQDAYNYYRTHMEEVKVPKEDEFEILDFFQTLYNLGDYLTPLNFKDFLFFLKDKKNQFKYSFLLLDCSFLFDDLKCFENILNYLEKNFEFLSEREKYKFFLNNALLCTINGDGKGVERLLERCTKLPQELEDKEKNKFFIQLLTFSSEMSQKFGKLLKSEEETELIDEIKNINFEDAMKKYLKTLNNKDLFKEKLYRNLFEEMLRESNFSLSQLKKLAEFLSIVDTYFLNDHNQKVKDMTLKICEAGKNIWDKNIDIGKIEKGAYFHDLGKLNIPWALIDKKIPLNEKEMEKFKGHSLLTYEILNKSGFENEAIYALDHHKYLNGKGYPQDNFKPTFEGNVICLAESFIGAVNLNSRTKVREKEELLIEFKQLRGIYFYPQVVDALLLLE